MGNVEIPNWLKKLPLAPTFYPTDTEFADPIAYISKIEKEASAFGICKVVPPLPKPSKKFVFSNLNKSLLKSPELDSSSLPPSHLGFGDKHNNDDARAVFTTRHQELGCSTKKTKHGVTPGLQSSVVHKQVWQSGEAYTLEQFESKAKSFYRSQLGMVKEVTPLVVESLFWKAASEKPIYIEYANDVPGSAFGEPEEVCQYFHRRRRRRRQSSQSYRQNPVNDFQNMGASSNSYMYSKNGASANHDVDSSALVSEESSRFRRQNSSNSSNDREGTAGWKLSNSPWNLQVISRSPGSLTRFMMDDIPGVTSPMIYIGMLFSWFAWHVEDHELHSLNFLHTGSPKTWYAVPGDYAFHFEEVIRSKGYGGDLDPLAALTLLGEKTNLLSPEVVISSGIPCCRLEQYPGEFVVTFPRAYHIGFSHGFNCGEAANFGTPQWLKVAKAAAVRRAAMNYLPMLSHQQLLYMLTMSFVSRVPRTLLPGVRTSRLKDRQKEERELLVKKAFIDDMLKEKDRVAVLLGKESTFSAVLWDPDALRSQESVPSETSAISTMSIRRTFVDYQNNDGSDGQVDSTRLSVEKLEDIYMEDDELPCGLVVDSGALPCVACGVLGFPFMSIVQPSSKISEELFAAELQLNRGPKDLESIKSNAPTDLCDAVMESVSDTHNYKEKKVSSSRGRTSMLMENSLWKFYTDANSTPSEATTTIEWEGAISDPYSSNVVSNCSMIHSLDGNSRIFNGGPLYSTNNSHKKWITADGFLRPRVFCLEHALEIEELLRSKGGANVLIICHSAYQKIKAHASVVAEEIGAPFDCDEVPLQCASKEDLDLISISIDNEEHEESREDWTSRLGLNLRSCAKLRKHSPFRQGQRAVALGGLFSDLFPGLDASSLKWKSRRSRTPYKIVGPSQLNSCPITQTEKSDVMKNIDRRNATGENKILQYSRRSCTSKAVSPLPLYTKHGGCSKEDQLEDVFTDEDVLDIPRDTGSIENGGNIVELHKPSTVNCRVQHKNCINEVNSDINEISDPPRFAASFSTKNTIIDFTKSAESLAEENTQLRVDSCNNVETNATSEVSNHVEWATVLGRQGEFVSETKEARGVSDITATVGSFAIPCSVVGTMEAQPRGKMVDEQSKGGIECDSVTVDSCKMHWMPILTDENSEMKDTSDPNKLPSSELSVISCSQIETRTLKEYKAGDEVCNNVISDVSQMQVECKTTAQPSIFTMVENSEMPEFQSLEETSNRGEACSSGQDALSLEDTQSTIFDNQSIARKQNKRRRELDYLTEDENSYNGFIKSPCEGLRPRTSRIATRGVASNVKPKVEAARKEAKRAPNATGSVPCKAGGLHECDIESCSMSFKTREQLLMHQGNKCTHKGCGKQFSSHRYAMLHQRVHMDERPLKCPWKGCTMSFKWAWARTEHVRVHTGERPYQCNVEGCGLTFRFVSDFSRHRRKSGHHTGSPS